VSVRVLDTMSMDILCSILEDKVVPRWLAWLRYGGVVGSGFLRAVVPRAADCPPLLGTRPSDASRGGGC